MKKLVLAIFVVCVAAFAVAQGPGGRPGGPGQGGPGGRGRMDPKARMEKMRKELNLSPAQVKKIETMDTARRAEFQKMRNSKMDRKAMGPVMKKMMDDYSAKMKGVLNKDQYAKWDKANKERMAKMRMGGGGRPGGPGGRPGGPGGPGGPPRGGGR